MATISNEAVQALFEYQNTCNYGTYVGKGRDDTRRELTVAYEKTQTFDELKGNKFLEDHFKDWMHHLR